MSASFAFSAARYEATGFGAFSEIVLSVYVGCITKSLFKLTFSQVRTIKCVASTKVCRNYAPASAAQDVEAALRLLEGRWKLFSVDWHAARASADSFDWLPSHQMNACVSKRIFTRCDRARTHPATK